ncbi:MAG TPA: hypothetical protein VKG45_03955 [Actinomycetes bacterium]|nr:hypothetical protein [Actinomycetes bacterium]
MFAIIAAIIFGLALLFDLFDAKVGDAFSNATLVNAGLLCIALHLAGVGGGWRWRR